MTLSIKQSLTRPSRLASPMGGLFLLMGNGMGRKQKKPPKNTLKPYYSRNKRLRSMGFKSYQEYLSSDLWKTIRERVLERDQYLCRICGDKARVAHHTNYNNKTLCGDSIGGLISVCYKCHGLIEFDQDGNKIHPMQVRKRVFYLSKRNGINFDPNHHNAASSRPAAITHRMG